MLRFINSQKETRKLELNGFLYTKHKAALHRCDIWRFEGRTCRARVHTQNDECLKEWNEHTHTVSHGKSLVSDVRAAMKRQA